MDLRELLRCCIRAWKLLVLGTCPIFRIGKLRLSEVAFTHLLLPPKEVRVTGAKGLVGTLHLSWLLFQEGTHGRAVGGKDWQGQLCP